MAEELAEVSSRRLGCEDVAGRAEESWRRLGCDEVAERVQMSSERLEPVEVACPGLHNHQT